MALGPGDLVLSCMAMTRVEPGWTFDHASWHDRCIAAAAGGFAAIGIVPDVYDEARAAGHSDAELKSMLVDAGVIVGEIEGLAIPKRSQRDAAARQLDRMLDVADKFGAERIFFAATPNVPFDDLVDMFGWACDRVAELGLPAGIEFMSIPQLSMSLPDAASALRLVEAAGRDNGGVVVDNYHHANGANDWGQLESLPGERVTGIQLSDTAVPRTVDDVPRGYAASPASSR